MRTTLDIDDDVLETAEKLSADQHKSAGQLISEWARRGIPTHPKESAENNGFEIIPAEGRVIAREFVARMLEDSETE
jgi:hypothetical protein